MAGTAASGRVTVQVLCLLDIQVGVRVFIGRPVIDVEETLIAAKVARRKTDALDRVETITGILPVSGQRATYFKPIWCRWRIRTRERCSRRVERSSLQGVRISRLRGTDEDILQSQSPMAG